VGGHGVLDEFPLPLSEEEHALLGRSAGIVRAAIDSLHL
jgi:hypothetical protein